MRPDGVESLRAIQGAVAGVLAPELRTLFAEEAAGAAGMLIESLAAEWDTAAETLLRDNETLRTVLGEARGGLAALSNERAAGLVKEIDGVLGQAGDGSLAVSSLTLENNRLREQLASFLELAEDVDGTAEAAALAPAREGAYRHLRQVAVRGWSFFDVSGFRERMMQVRAEQGK
jgi:hypothetical protein